MERVWREKKEGRNRRRKRKKRKEEEKEEGGGRGSHHLGSVRHLDVCWLFLLGQILSVNR